MTTSAERFARGLSNRMELGAQPSEPGMRESYSRIRGSANPVPRRWRLSLKRNVPSPPRRTRGREASTEPSWFVAVDLVEAARSWGGQPCVHLRPKLSHYLLGDAISADSVPGSSVC